MTHEMSNKQKICPKCFSQAQVFRSRARNGFERLINSSKILSMYRCHECGWRGIRFRNIKLKLKLSSIIRFFLLIFLSYFIALFVLRQVFKISFFK